MPHDRQAGRRVPAAARRRLAADVPPSEQSAAGFINRLRRGLSRAKCRTIAPAPRPDRGWIDRLRGAKPASEESTPYQSTLPSIPRRQVKPCPRSAPTIFAPISIRGWQPRHGGRQQFARQGRRDAAEGRRQGRPDAQIARRGDQPHSRLRQRRRAARAARGGGLAESRCDAGSDRHRPRAGGKTRADRSGRPHARPGRHLRPARHPALSRAQRSRRRPRWLRATSSGSMPRRPCR